jgi:hypothetical protein
MTHKSSSPFRTRSIPHFFMHHSMENIFQPQLLSQVKVILMLTGNMILKFTNKNYPNTIPTLTVIDQCVTTYHPGIDLFYVFQLTMSGKDY